MPYFKGQNPPNSISAGTLSQTPLGELTALPKTFWLHLMGPTSKGKRRKGKRKRQTGRRRREMRAKSGG